jgi:hypothetical protein
LNNPLNQITTIFYRTAASGLVPASWFLPDLLPEQERAAKTGKLSLEIVSHCWNYAHLLVYQLNSLVLHPPLDLSVMMTVFYCDDDQTTARLLDRFNKIVVPGIRWNWQPLPRNALMRRAIGRNRAALNTTADWVWFTDCDLLFHDGCLTGLAEQLQGRRDALVYPRQEHCTALLPPTHALLQADPANEQINDIATGDFTPRERGRATGPLQIVHGDVARAHGYCDSLAFYQRPAQTWCKAHEDRALRWLLRTRGTALEIPGVYRIRHADKGRYTGNSFISFVRGWFRREKS